MIFFKYINNTSQTSYHLIKFTILFLKMSKTQSIMQSYNNEKKCAICHNNAKYVILYEDKSIYVCGYIHTTHAIYYNILPNVYVYITKIDDCKFICAYSSVMYQFNILVGIEMYINRKNSYVINKIGNTLFYVEESQLRIDYSVDTISCKQRISLINRMKNSETQTEPEINYAETQTEPEINYAETQTEPEINYAETQTEPEIRIQNTYEFNDAKLNKDTLRQKIIPKPAYNNKCLLCDEVSKFTLHYHYNIFHICNYHHVKTLIINYSICDLIYIYNKSIGVFICGTAQVLDEFITNNFELITNINVSCVVHKIANTITINTVEEYLANNSSEIAARISYHAKLFSIANDSINKQISEMDKKVNSDKIIRPPKFQNTDKYNFYDIKKETLDLKYNTPVIISDFYNDIKGTGLSKKNKNSDESYLADKSYLLEIINDIINKR